MALRHFMRILLTRSLATTRLSKSNNLSSQVQQQVSIMQRQGYDISEVEPPSAPQSSVRSTSGKSNAGTKDGKGSGKQSQNGVSNSGVNGTSRLSNPTQAPQQRRTVSVRDLSFVAQMGSGSGGGNDKGCGSGISNGRILGAEHEMHLDRIFLMEHEFS